MDKEKKYFLQILSDYINKRNTSIDVELDWQKMLLFANQHQVTCIIYYQCKALLDGETAKRLLQQYTSSLFYYVNRETYFKDIDKRFSEDHIPFYTVKGLKVAQLYPVPALRTMGDCDLIVHSEDKQRAHEAMLSLGYMNHDRQDMEWTYFKNNLEFEIHDHLLYDEVVNSQISKDFTDLAWEYTEKTNEGYCYDLDWNFHLVFLILHLKKHFLNKGVGFRQFMDLVVVIQHQKLNWEWLNSTLQKLELLEFTKVCFAFCERWFDVKMPLVTSLAESFFEEATEKIFCNGVFGFNDSRNRENSNLNQLIETGKIRTIIERILPSYKNVKYVNHYSFVNGRPWLLPLVWIYRPIRSLIYGKGADGINMLGSALKSDQKVEERKEMMKQWGL